MGIDLEDKTGSCCLWELYFHLFPRPWRTESSQGLIRACQGWCLHRNADSEPCWKEASNPGLERFSGLLKVTLLVKFSSPGKQSGKLETCPPLTVWPQFMVPFWAAVSSALRDRVCLFACPAILTSPGSQQSAVCWCPHHLQAFSCSSAWAFSPASLGILRETDSHSVNFWSDRSSGPSISWPLYHTQYSRQWDKWPRHKHSSNNSGMVPTAHSSNISGVVPTAHRR